MRVPEPEKGWWACGAVVGSWVRPRGGVYKGDLGRVFDVDSQANKCTVVLIPRLDYAAMAQRREEGRSLPFGRTNNNIRPAAKCAPLPLTCK